MTTMQPAVTAATDADLGVAVSTPLFCECTGDPDGCAEAAAYRVRWLCLDPACPDYGSVRTELLCGPCTEAARERCPQDWDGANRL